MTLIVGFGHPDQIVLASDRRLSSGPTVADDEAGKIYSVAFADFRGTVSFTGIARCVVPGSGEQFDTHRWLGQSLCHIASDSTRVGEIVSALASQASVAIGALSPSVDRRLSILFLGFRRDETGAWAPFYALVSNFEDLEGRSLKPGVDFSYFEKPPDAPSRFVRSIGASSLISPAEYARARDLLEKPSPVQLAKAIDLIRTAAGLPQGGGIGRQISSVAIARDPAVPAVHRYHSQGSFESFRIPGHIDAQGPGCLAIAYSDVEAIHKDEDWAPLTLMPRVGRNKPCVCGSGLKFKRCCIDFKSWEYQVGAGGAGLSGFRLPPPPSGKMYSKVWVYPVRFPPDGEQANLIHLSGDSRPE